MSVRVRLTRVGSKKNPIWRVVVADQRSPRDGRFIETIGRYNPQTDPSTIAIDEERLEHWLARGAQPTGAVKQLMKAQAKAGGAQVAGEEAETAAGAVAAEPAAAPEAAGSTAAAAAAPSGAPATPEPAAPEAAERAAAESAASEAAAPEPAAPAEGEPDSEAAERDS
jgi:small subunit ribosomal protein S16